MEIDKLKGMVKRLSIIGIVCLILLGVVGFLTNIYVDVNYLHQIQKYRFLKVGMSKEEVQAILRSSRPFSKLPAEIKPNNVADEIWGYVFRLGSESGGYFVLFYKQNKLIEKAAFADGVPLADKNSKMTWGRGSIYRNLGFIVIILIGITPLWVCIRIARGTYLIQNRDNALYVIIVCMVIAFCFSILFGLIDLSNGFEISCILY